MRHWIGVIAGLLLTPVIFIGLAFGTGRAVRGWEMLYLPWIGLSALAGTAVVVGVLAGSRVSPAAALVPGLALTAVGVMQQLSVVVHGLPVDTLQKALPAELRAGYLAAATSGALLVAGLVLLVSSAFPSRWHARAAAAPYPRPEPAWEQTTRPLYRE